MINYSITARAVNNNLFDINQAKARIAQAKAEGKTPDTKDEALVESVVTNYFATAQYTEVMGIEKFARHIADHGTTYSRADIMAILYMAVDCMREQLLEGKKIRLGELRSYRSTYRLLPQRNRSSTSCNSSLLVQSWFHLLP